ncbi:MAG TPA: GNAT family protein [Thermomicrobiaceae bacterium]|nr:GNAT family protein [Thermomicrobiaceae bacterium]
MRLPEDASDRPVINVEGERVALGPLRRDLVPRYRRWSNDFRTLRTLGDMPAPVPAEAMEALYAGVMAIPDAVAFTIYVRDAPGASCGWRPVGTYSLVGIDHRNRTAEFVIYIGEPSERGKGYGTEATRLTLDYAFTALGLHSVLLKVYAFNLAGLRTYQKAGFREIGRRRQAHHMGGRLWDVILMDCLATDFARAGSSVLSAVFAPDHPRD